MLSFVFLLVMTLLAAACSSGSASPTAAPTTATPGAATPQAAVKAFFDAVYTGQDTSALVCTANSNAAETFQIAGAASRATGSSVDTSGLTFTVKSQTADQATVTVAGQLVYTLLTTSTTNPFPPTDVTAVNESGTWKFCGSGQRLKRTLFSLLQGAWFPSRRL